MSKDNKEVKIFEPTDKEIEHFEAYLEKIANGEPTRNIKESKDGISLHKFYKIVDSSPILEKQYMRACALRGEAIAEKSVKVLEDCPVTIIVNGVEQQNTAGIMKAKAISENCRWHAGKLNKVFSDKAETNINTQINTGEGKISLNIGGEALDLSTK